MAHGCGALLSETHERLATRDTRWRPRRQAAVVEQGVLHQPGPEGANSEA